ncbi:BCLAF1 and THRAP3 family member 3 isoform X2 [Varanus komodoensis]|uniref:BCLAF1 and THRAP3 family member 3 n=1 Tax=Varanus komodoensis TaxID=61221 RepID=A0A8D2J189_VARKO|nr:BCLAF1 and THRAP3 family member 3 isoform X2 [Varanus komodoensis]
MVRSRLRSPRWKRRSLSPALRSQEHGRQRHNHINYDSEYKTFRKDLKKPMPWRVDDGKHGQANSRYTPHETNHHRLHERRSYSPTLKRISAEDIHSHKSCRTHSSERNENIRRCPFPSRYSEMSRKEHSQSFYPPKTRVREVHEETRAVANAKEIKTFHRPLDTSCKFERKWNENNLRYHQSQEDQSTQSPRRFSNELMPRISFQKRYPEDREYREYGHTSKRAKEMERYDDGEIASNSKWKQDLSSIPKQEKQEQRNLGFQTYRPVEKEYSDSCPTKITYDYSHKRHRHPDGGKYISDEKRGKYIKVEDKKYTYSKGAWNSKYSDYYSNERVNHSEESCTEVAMKYISGKGCNSSYKSDAGLLPFDQKEKERIKKDVDVRGRIDSSNSHQHDTHHSISDVKVSDVHTKKEKLTVKVDMKKAINKYRGASSHIMERQTSRDLVAVGRKTENFHPVFEHIKSVMQKVEQNPSKEFAQEIITIIHQVKANYFKSSALTLHERFSKIQDKPVVNEVKRHPDPEIHRRIDMSLAELQNKGSISCESGKSAVRILEDPNDLRHDIERRRKERLQNEDENTFYVDGVSQRDEHGCSFPKLRNPQPYGFQKSSRFLNSPFRKFIRKPHMNHHYAAKPRDNIVHEQFEGNLETSHRPFKPHFTDGRPHFRSNLVQKGLYIQAKYQRLRYAGARGFTTNKIRRGFLRKEQDLEI